MRRPYDGRDDIRNGIDESRWSSRELEVLERTRTIVELGSAELRSSSAFRGFK